MIETRTHEPLGRSGDSTAWPGLYFIGYTLSLRGHLFETNRDSRRLARNVAAYLAAEPLPSRAAASAPPDGRRRRDASRLKTHLR